MVNIASELTEQSLLMCLMRAPEIYNELKFLVKKEHFSFITTQKLFSLIEEWIDTFQGIDIHDSVGFQEFLSYIEFNHSDWFIKNKEFLNEAQQRVVDRDQAKEKWRYFYSHLEKYYFTSAFIELIDNTKKISESSPLNIKETINSLQGNIAKLYTGINFLDSDTSLKQNIDKYHCNFMKRIDSKYSPAYTGLKNVDELFGGFFPNTYSLLTARSSVGKSALVQTMAKNMVITQGKQVAVFNLEMDNFDFLSRWFSQDLKISSRYLRNPGKDLTEAQRTKLIEHEQDLASKYANKLHLIDDIYDCSHLIDKIMNIYHTYGLDVVFIDLIEYIKTRRHFENNTRTLAYISNEFFELRKKIDVAIVMVQQQNKGGDNKVEQGSGRGSEDPFIQSDLSIGLFKKELENGDLDPNARVVSIMKNRHGETGTITVKFNKDLTMFEDDSLNGKFDN